MTKVIFEQLLTALDERKNSMVITNIEFMVTSFRFEQPMKVAFATITDMDSCIVKIQTDEGITGYGEAAPLPYCSGHVRADLYFARMEEAMSEIASGIGHNIRVYRKKKGLTLDALSEIVCKSKSTLSKYEKGEIAVDIETLYDAPLQALQYVSSGVI